MALYEYYCDTCEIIFEELKKVEDRFETTCPNCNCKNVVLQTSAGGFILKGEGFYKPSRSD